MTPQPLLHIPRGTLHHRALSSNRNKWLLCLIRTKAWIARFDASCHISSKIFCNASNSHDNAILPISHSFPYRTLPFRLFESPQFSQARSPMYTTVPFHTQEPPNLSKRGHRGLSVLRNHVFQEARSPNPLWSPPFWPSFQATTLHRENSCNRRLAITYIHFRAQ